MNKTIRALYDDEKIKRLRVRCRCSNEWVEEIPSELYEAHFISPIFKCASCKQEYYLLDKHVRRVETDPFQPPMKEYNYGQVRKDGKYDA